MLERIFLGSNMQLIQFLVFLLVKSLKDFFGLLFEEQRDRYERTYNIKFIQVSVHSKL